MNSRLLNMILRSLAVGILPLFCLCSCTHSPQIKQVLGATYSNPIVSLASSTSISFIDGKYYYLQLPGEGTISLRISNDPTLFEQTQRNVVCDLAQKFGLHHIWRPQIIRINNVWYIYLTADDGNTDNHQIYVLENPAQNPLDGTFAMRGRISTDQENNWGIHAHVFFHSGQLYMVWSGWESRRFFTETQCLFIAKMKNPWTLDSARKLISKPQYEWECQWVNVDGSVGTTYPLFVNEAPVYFCTDKTDKVYIYYSASAHWTPYSVIGELSALRGSDLLDPASWSKNENPAFSQNSEVNVFGPCTPNVVPSPDGTEHYLLYMAKSSEMEVVGENNRGIYMQKIEILPNGKPSLGVPTGRGVEFAKPSGI